MWFNILIENHQKAERAVAQNVRYLRAALWACGHEVTIVQDQVHPDAVNLFLEGFSGRDYAADFIRLRDQGASIGVVAPELLLRESIDSNGLSKARLESFERVLGSIGFLWSFLPRVAARYGHLCAISEIFPVGFVESVPASERRAPKDLDVVFFGAATPHRLSVLEGLSSAGINVFAVGEGMPGAWVPDFMVESLLDRAKIALNLTAHGAGSVPMGIDTRAPSAQKIRKMLERGACVVSEEIPLDNPYQGMMVSAPATQLADVCHRLIREGSWRDAGRAAEEQFRSTMSARELCTPVIERTLRALSVSAK